MEFEVKTVLDAKTVMDYQRLAGRTIQRSRTVLIRAALVVVGLLGLTLCGFGMAAIGGANLTIGVGVVLSALCLMMGLSWYQYQARKSLRGVPAEFEQRFYFSDAGVVAKSESEQLLHNYSDFCALAESEDYFALFLNRRSGYLLPKSGFLAGDVKAFGRFIQEKTGKEITRAKL